MRSFTLVEIVVSLFIFSLMLTSMFMILAMGRSSWLVADTSMHIQDEIRKSLFSIEQDLSQSALPQTNLSSGNSIVLTPGNGALFSFTVPQDLDNDGICDITASPAEWSPQMSYSLNANGQLVRNIVGTGNTVVANNITNLRFDRQSTCLPAGTIDANVICVNITAQDTTVLGRVILYNNQALVKTRN